MGAWRTPEVQILQQRAIMLRVPGGHRKCSYYSMELSWYRCLGDTGSTVITAWRYHGTSTWRTPEVQILQQRAIMLRVPGGHRKCSY
ncbi:hypothetical protein NDU88_000837 [Pleurodeles waltl]|nr:hypothetical protein NDU88_000837 [Pleurodeles waltl]